MTRYVLDLLGVAVFAISGVLAAGRKGLDVLGVAVIAVVTAVGGGTLRDLLLDRHPIFWIANPVYLWVILAATAVTLAYVRFWVESRSALLVADALGLAFFTIAGVQLTQQAGHSAGIALLMGTITGVAGGVIRDVLTADIPLVLRPGLLYATAAVAGAGLYLGLAQLGAPKDLAALVGMAGIVGLRLGAILRDGCYPWSRSPVTTPTCRRPRLAADPAASCRRAPARWQYCQRHAAAPSSWWTSGGKSRTTILVEPAGEVVLRLFDQRGAIRVKLVAP